MSYCDLVNNEHHPIREEALQLLEALLACPSVTPLDAGCQKMIAARLETIGFVTEWLPVSDVTNAWIRFGKQDPLFVFAGHTDVVPPGPAQDWRSPPFKPTRRDGVLYGRGASDMKGALAAMVIATETFVAQYPNFPGSIAFLLTSDEEGPAVHGTAKVIETLQARHEKIKYCVVGEPSSIEAVGDQIRIGRRGSLHGELMIHGIQGHVAHPHLAKNPIHQSLNALAELVSTIWDEGNQDFPATTFQITNIHAGDGATNVIPGHLSLKFNFRFGNALTVHALQARTEHILNQHGLTYTLTWKEGAKPFLTEKGRLINITQKAIASVTGLTTILSTGGGTSDARFISPTGAEVVELGVLHATAHHVDENVAIKHLDQLVAIYQQILVNLFIA